MARLANRGAADVVRDRVPGLRRFHIDKCSELVRRGDPRLWQDMSYVNERYRQRLEETSPAVRQAARQLEALLAGEPVIVPRPVKRDFPDVTEIDWLDDGPHRGADDRPPRYVVVYAGDYVEPA
ncbi:MAG TPA: hypothetical protein VME67_03730 [Mycobacterium sp.]|nr:hypothetical protein [Mycobacterium sp.]HTX94013.1 hypothetical protein [Mycobacterium sp.]